LPDKFLYFVVGKASMINLFRSLNPINIIILAAYTLFMRLAIFMNLPETLNFEFLESYTNFFIQIPLTNSLSPLLNIVIASALIFLQALLFNRIVNNHGLLAKPSYLPALLYITGSSLFLQFLILSPPLICNFLLIWMMDKFMKISKASNAMMNMFDVGMIMYC
jgi:hypothetical protein